MRISLVVSVLRLRILDYKAKYAFSLDLLQLFPNFFISKRKGEIRLDALLLLYARSYI
jgi:hypothetical protein